MIKDPRRTPFRVETEDGDDRRFLVSVRTTTPRIVSGATVGPPCFRCGMRIWIAPSSRPALDDPRIVPICQVCAETDPVLRPVLERVAAQVREHGIPEEG